MLIYRVKLLKIQVVAGFGRSVRVRSLDSGDIGLNVNHSYVHYFGDAAIFLYLFLVSVWASRHPSIKHPTDG